MSLSWSHACPSPSTPTRSGASTPTSSASESSETFFSGICTPHTDIFDSQTLHATTEDERVLIVGGLGYIGSHTTWELLKAGHNVVIIDNLSNSYKDVFQRLQRLLHIHYTDSTNSNTPSKPPHLTFHEADYRDIPTMTSILSQYINPSTQTPSIKSVIHFAAHKSSSESIHQPLKYYTNNVAGLIDFTTLLTTLNIKTLIFSSSATIYGHLATLGGRLHENQTVHAPTTWSDASNTPHTTLQGCTGLTTPYGRSKWMGEAILADLAASDPEWRVVALRYFNPVGCDASGLLGEDPRGMANNLMPCVVRAMLGDVDAVGVFGHDWETRDGTAVRDFIHVSDLARGHVAALVSGGEAGFHAFNLGTGCGSSVMEVVETMRKVSGREIRTVRAGRREGDVGVCVADPAEAERMLGWRPVMTLEDSCRDICRYLEAHAGV